jgi:hypothetical protein
VLLRERGLIITVHGRAGYLASCRDTWRSEPRRSPRNIPEQACQAFSIQGPNAEQPPGANVSTVAPS